MSRKPRVSCIIIFLNDESYLEEAIQSVVGQTFAEWELLLVNDGSDDGSIDIAHRHVSRMPERVHYLEHEGGRNRGKNASRNLGVQHSRGEFVALLDSDDVWLPRKLEEQVAILGAIPEAAMIYGRTEIWSSWAGVSQQNPDDSLFDLGVEPDSLIDPPRLFLQLLEGWAQTPTTCNALMRKSVFDEIGDFDEDYHDIFEDQTFFAKVELAYPVFVADNVWARYRQHPESSYAQYSQANAQDRALHYSALLKFLNWIEKHLADENYEDPTVRAFVQNRKAYAKRNLRLVQNPVLGPLVISLLHFTEWSLGMVAQIGRRTLPAPVRQWLWTRVGKKIYMNL